MERSVTILEKHLGREHLSVAEALNRLAHLHEEQGDRCWMNPAAGEPEAQGHYARAEAYQKRALVMRQKLLGPHHPEVAQSLNNLAHLYTKLDRDEEAEPLYKQAAAIWEKAGEAERRNLATALKNLAELYDSQGRYAEAERFYQRVLTIGEAKVSGLDSTHFNQPTDVAIASDGSFYVSDGYGNSRVARFAADGAFLFDWGE